MSGRLYDLEAEAGIIQAVLVEPQLLETLHLQPEHFHLPSHQTIWRKALEASAESGEIDPILLADEVGKESEEARRRLLDIVASPQIVGSKVRHYELIVLRHWQAREAYAAAMDMANRLASSADPERMIATTVARMEEILEKGSLAGEAIDSQGAAERAVEEIESDRAQGISSGFSVIDDFFRLHPGYMYVMAARPGMGKTALADQIAENVAAAGRPVLFVSLEMDIVELTLRRISRRAKVEVKALRSKRFKRDPDASYRVEQALNHYRGLRGLYVYDDPSANIAKVIAQARQMKRKHPDLGLVVIDYLQQMIESVGREVNPVHEVTRIARAGKVLARELEVPVLFLSQLSRAVEARKDKRPILSDLRESGGVEQAADVVFMLYREAYYEPEKTSIPDVNGEIVELLVRKNRSGEVGTARMLFEPQYTRFFEV